MLRHRNRRVVVRRSEISQLAKAVRHDVEDRPVVRQRDILDEPGDTSARQRPDRTGVRHHIATHYLKKRRLAGTVSADYTDALVRLDLYAGILEQRQVAVCHRNVIEGDERH